MDENIFKNNPAFTALTPEKLAFLSNFANAQKPNNMKDMMPFMMQFLGNAKANNIQFTSAETELLIQVLKQNLSPAESAKADQIISLMKNRRSGF